MPLYVREMLLAMLLLLLQLSTRLLICCRIAPLAVVVLALAARGCRHLYL